MFGGLHCDLYICVKEEGYILKKKAMGISYNVWAAVEK